jgi:hypothetical protein
MAEPAHFRASGIDCAYRVLAAQTSIGGSAMKLLLASMIVAGVAVAGVAQAAEKNVCQWTGGGWACGDGNTFPTHYNQATGPNMTITPIETIDQARVARASDPSRPH